MRRSTALAVLLVPACAQDTGTGVVHGDGSTAVSDASTADGVPGPPTGADSRGPHDTSGEATSSGAGETTSTGAGESSGADESGGADETTSTGADGTMSTGTGTGATSGPAPGCDDGLRNQDETDVDCGGVVCAPCAPGGACLVGADCDVGRCEAQVCGQPGCLVDADCEALAGDCVAASCDLTLGTCVTTAVHEGLACDDGFVCTQDDVCVAGACTGGPEFLLLEDFSTPKLGWDLGPTWEIGPALASSATWNGADPASDHSPGHDEALAGTVIGGPVPPGSIARTCITSPVLPAGDAGAPGELWLSFWRHLHTDHAPFVVHTVEAHDGQYWQILEAGYAEPGINDAGWTFVEYDLTWIRHPLLRVRICHEQTGSAAQTAGWSIDDVTAGPHPCTPEG